MKYIAAILVAGGVYMFLSHHGPVSWQAAKASEPAMTPGTDFLKEPLDRTHEVLSQVKQNTKDPALQ
jgi:hypothetical protein